MKSIQQFEKETGIKFNKNMSGKMDGITCLFHLKRQRRLEKDGTIR